MTGRWFYMRMGDERGPILPEGLKAMADFGSLKADDLVREEGSEQWVEARRLSGLFPAKATVSGAAGVETGTVVAESRGASDKPMIPFLPHAMQNVEAEAPKACRRWQVSIQQLLIATVLLATACGVVAFETRNAWAGWPLAIAAALAVTSLVGGAVGVVVRRTKAGFLCGLFVGIVLRFVGIFGLMMAIGALIVFWRPHSKIVGRRDEAAIAANRQRSIYWLTAICWTILLFLWLPIVFTVPRGRGCRPMGQVVVTMLFILPATVIGIGRATQQLVVADKKSLGLVALCAAVSPILIYAALQWLILSVCGIIYED